MNKKIVYVTSRCPFENWEIWAIREMNSLVEAGIDLTIIPRTGYGKIIHKEALKLEKRTIATPFFNLPIVFALIKKVITQPSDFVSIIKWIITQSNSLSDFTKGLVVLPKSLFISNKLKGKGIEHIHAFSTTSVAVVAYILSSELKVPWSLTVHSAWHLNSKHTRSTIAQVSTVRFVRAISNEVNQSIINSVGEKYTAKIKTLHIGVKCDTLSPKQVNSKKDFTIASIGHLLPHKGVDISLDAANFLLKAGISNFIWIFYGEGPLLEELVHKAKLLSLTENVKFAGRIDNNDLLDLYKKGEIDLLIQNSIERFGISEGIPVSLMEAMAYSVPVIATDCGGTKELVDGNSGILVHQNDNIAVANAIMELINNTEYRVRLGQKGRDKILSEFNSQKIALNLKNAFFINENINSNEISIIK